jgi:hypothetical protein
MTVIVRPDEVSYLAQIDENTELGFRLGGRPYATTISAAGDSVVRTPAAGKRLRIYWIGMSTSENNSAETKVTIKFGTDTLYIWNMSAPGAFSKGQMIIGELDEPLSVNLSQAQPVDVNITYDEV